MKKRAIGRKDPAKGVRKSARPAEVSWVKLVYQLFERIAQDLAWDGPTDLVKGAIRARDWGRVLSATKANPPQLYADEQQYFAACQVEHLFKKLPVPGSEQAAEAAAWSTFLADEKRNRRTNQKFRLWNARDWRHKNPLYTRLMGRMQKFVADVLGPAPSFEAVYGCCDFGPGSSVGVGGDSTHPYAKLDKLTCSTRAIPYALGAYWANHQIREMYSNGRFLIDSVPTECTYSLSFPFEGPAQEPVTTRVGSGHGYVHCVDPAEFELNFSAVLERVDYNKIDFVEKNFKTKRTTASEPVANGYVQTGAGTEIANRLRNYRPFLNIWDQTRNQRMAKAASMDIEGRSRQCTIDLKSSSQSLATQMVKGVCSHVPEWFQFLDDIRSPGYSSRHGSGRYELFVSMGNGFCFPLQTMIYAAAVEAVYAEIGCGAEYAVYGDDIIVDQSAALLLIEWLKYLGVRTNVDKTFIFGPFRESCGADFFNGTNVRPYVLDFIPTRARDLVKIANGLSTRAAYPLWGAWWAVWYMMPQYARATVRPWIGPDDTGLTVPVSFYDVVRLDEYDHELQRYKVNLFRSDPERDLGDYVSKTQSAGQSFLAYRGRTPQHQQRVLTGRDGPVHAHAAGTPVPSFRRKTRTAVVLA